MNEVAIQKRFVGTLILLTLFILVAWTFLDGSGRVPEALTTQDLVELKAPTFPAVPKTPVQPNVASEPVVVQPNIEPVVRDLPVNKPSVNEASGPIDAPSVADSSSPAWSVQVGSFKAENAARRLLESLTGAGYDAYLNEVRLSNGSLFTQVLVGSYLDVDEARSVKDRLKEQLALSGLVVPNAR